MSGWQRFLEWSSDADRYPEIPWLNRYNTLIYRREAEDDYYEDEEYDY